MFVLAVFLGTVAYLIFFLGLFGLLSSKSISFVVLCSFFLYLFFQRRTLIQAITSGISTIKSWNSNQKKTKFIVCVVLLIFLQALINFLGALGPELGFDALWYHLTLPKLYLLQHKIYYIPGGLLYYSAMPKLAEMLYTIALAFGNEISANLIHFSFGILICIAIYKLSRQFFSSTISLLAVTVFYANLVVAWESSSAYIDLIRAFFELMALWGFINWFETRHIKWLTLCAVLAGFAVTTKLLAIGSIIIFAILIIVLGSKNKVISIRAPILYTVYFILISLIIPLPWFIFSYMHTGNPIYPFFTHTYPISDSPSLVNPINFFSDLWVLFTHAADPISPVYIIFSPLIIFVWTKLRKEVQLVAFYSLLAVIVWYFTPRTGGGRFILPYLPAFSLVSAGIVDEFSKHKKRFGVYLEKALISIIIIVSIISIGYRFMANRKYFPVVLGKESKDTFLSNNLNFSYGDFFDADGYLLSHISASDTVLLYGFHNLYYANFPFIDATWIKKGDQFNYIATQNTQLPDRFKQWKLIYFNQKTMIKLYKSDSCKKKCIY